MTRIALALVLSLAASVTLADHPHDAVAHISAWPSENPYPGMEGAGGSGTLLGISKDGKRGFLIGAAHVFERGCTRAITCTFPVDNKRRRCRILGIDRRYDVAALEVSSPPRIKTPRITVARKQDEPFTICGYPFNANGRLRWNQGRWITNPGNGESAWLPSMLHTSAHSISGQSGGATFNRRGEYVAVVSGNTGHTPDNMNRTWGCSGDALLKFTGRYMRIK